MNRNTRTIIVLIVALAVAGIASYAVFAAVQRATPPTAATLQTKAGCAAKPLPVGTLVNPEDVKVVPWPAASQIPGAFTSIEQVTNLGLVELLSENEPVAETTVARGGGG